MILRKILAWINILRLHNILLSFIGVLIGVFIVAELSSYNDLSVILMKALYVSIPALLVASAGYISNDYYDIETDKISKPWRPLVRGDISPKTARIAYILMYISAFVYSISLIGFLTTLFVLFNIFVVESYNSFFKRKGFIGNIFVSLATANLMIYGSLSYAEKFSGLESFNLNIAYPSLFAFLLTLSREIIKGVEDIKGDIIIKAETLAVRLGYKKAALIALLIEIMILVILILMFHIRFSMYFVALSLLTIAIAIYSTQMIFRSNDLNEAIHKAGMSRSLTKISLIIGVLSFLIWSLRI